MNPKEVMKMSEDEKNKRIEDLVKNGGSIDSYPCFIHGVGLTREQIRYAHEFLYSFYNSRLNLNKLEWEAEYISPVTVLLAHPFDEIYDDYVDEYLDGAVKDLETLDAITIPYRRFLNWACLEYGLLPVYSMACSECGDFADKKVPHLECRLVRRTYED